MLICEVCKKSYGTRYSLRRHRDRFHPHSGETTIPISPHSTTTTTTSNELDPSLTILRQCLTSPATPFADNYNNWYERVEQKDISEFRVKMPHVEHFNSSESLNDVSVRTVLMEFKKEICRVCDERLALFQPLKVRIGYYAYYQHVPFTVGDGIATIHANPRMMFSCDETENLFLIALEECVALDSLYQFEKQVYLSSVPMVEVQVWDMVQGQLQC